MVSWLLASSWEGHINRLITCSWRWYTRAATDRLSRYSRRPPTNRNPCMLKSGTGGEKSNFPSNQGFTVCESEEVTSVKWSTIKERTWPAITSCSAYCGTEGLIQRDIVPHNTMTRQATAVPRPTQRHDRLQALVSVWLTPRITVQIRCFRGSGGVK